MAKRKPAKPTVKRGAGGKIESLRRPIAPVAGEQDTPKPVVSPAPTKRKKTRAAIPETTAKKALILGGCRRTHVAMA